jgi:hypothetical protein
MLFFLQYLCNKQMQKDFINENKMFYKSNLEGLIEVISIENHGTSLKLRNDKYEYIFYPMTDDRLNDGHIFMDFARPGDSVRKPPFSDTLFLIKKGKTFKYEFRYHK